MWHIAMLLLKNNNLLATLLTTYSQEVMIQMNSIYFYIQDEKRSQALDVRLKSRKSIGEQIQRAASRSHHQLQQASEQRHRSSQHRKHLQRERTFTGDFGTQNSAVSNALLKHDKRAITEDRGANNLERVHSVKLAEIDQRKIVSQVSKYIYN